MTSVRAPLQLPDTIALFPLSGVMLLPFGHIPLSVYEPRYISLIDDMLGQSRLIGVVQPRQDCEDPIPNDVDLFDVGTVGRIVQFTDPGDGRYHVTLEGISRFLIKSSVVETIHGYRQALVDFSPYHQDPYPTEQSEGPGRDRILNLMKEYFSSKEIDADWDAVADAPYEALVSSLAMSCPFESTEKQALLECSTHHERAEMLISLFEMNSADVTTSPGLKH